MKRSLLFLIVLACIFSIHTSFAQQTEDQSQVGALFFDDFNTGPKPDWKQVSGNWTMANGMYTVAKIEENGLYFTFLDKEMGTDFVLFLDAKPGHTGSFYNEAIICPRMLSAEDGVCLRIASKYGAFVRAGWSVRKKVRITSKYGVFVRTGLNVRKKGEWGELMGMIQMDTPTGKIVNIKIEVKDNRFTAYLDGSQISQVYDASLSSGLIGVGQWYEGWNWENHRVGFDNLRVTTLEYAQALKDKPSLKEAEASKRDIERSTGYTSEAAATARKALNAASKAERAAVRAEQAAKAAQYSSKRAESMAKKAEVISERITAK
ncbi:MAG: hypothetical protein JRI52_05050 [Deltaproteobacteria bacterium]|nr:hypothetical protein [Deltaproteobacteria bacterium]